MVEGESQMKDVVAVQYYQRALKALSTLLAKSDSTHSDEILAPSIMLSRFFSIISPHPHSRYALLTTFPI